MTITEDAAHDEIAVQTEPMRPLEPPEPPSLTSMQEASEEPFHCTISILNALPKVVFLYPTAAFALMFGVLTNLAPGHAGLWGELFLGVFIFNLVVLAFEFPRGTSFTMLFFGVAAVLGFMLIESKWFDFMPGLRRISVHIHPTASDQFYWFVGVAIFLVIGGAVIVSRYFDYWEVDSNQIIHHHGFLHGEERFNANGARISKDITDIFEFVLLRAGRLIIQPEDGGAIVLDNVPGIDERAIEIEHLLSHLKVVVTNAKPARGPDPGSSNRKFRWLGWFKPHNRDS